MLAGIVEPAGLHAVGERGLGRRHAALGELHRLVLLVDDVVAGRLERFALLGLDLPLRHRAQLEAGDDAIDLVVEVGRFLGRPGDDQRGARFVDEDAVDFVDDGEVVPALDVLRELELHVVAQVVEAELVVGPVGDVGGVGGLALGVDEVVLDDADREAEEAVDAPHPLGVAAGQVVVDRDDVDALAGQRVQVGRQRRHQRLAFAGLHLGDAAAVQDHAADQLDVEVPHAEHAAAGLADQREGVGQEVVERFALVGAAAEIVAALAQAGVRERGEAAFALTDGSDERPQTLELALVLRADDFGEDGVENHGIGPVGAPRGGTTIQRLYLIGRRASRASCPACAAGRAQGSDEIRAAALGVEAPARQGAKSAHTGRMQATSNAARRDASAARVVTLYSRPSPYSGRPTRSFRGLTGRPLAHTS